MESLEKFDPTVEKLTALVAESAHIIEVNIEDPQQIEQVKRARLNLRTARVSIEKSGKAFRADALAYQKAVIEKERSLIAIIAPEEERLSVFEKQAKIAEERKLRLAQVPERRARLEALGLTTKESYITDMDSGAFEQHVNALVAEKNEAKRIEDDRIAREKEADLKAREDVLLEGERKLEADRLAKEAADLAVETERARVAKETEDRIAAEKEADRKRARDAKYQEFLTLNGYNANTKDQFKIEASEKGVMLWKFVAVFEEK